jgi:hypothetical protein
VACLAAALFIGHAIYGVPPADRPANPPTPPSEIAEPPQEVPPPSKHSDWKPSLPKQAFAKPAFAKQAWASDRTSISTAAFAYSKNHPATPLPALSLAAMAGTDDWSVDDRGTFDEPHNTLMDVDLDLGRLRMLSRGGLCSALAAVARANDLPIPFFANLIWQESSFEPRTISTAGALGIAQFMPETAVEHGLINPFETVHALFAAGKLLRKLNNQFGNLGLAAAAYNAGPQRVGGWMAERRTLPSETRAYVIRITGRPADQWLSSEIAHDPEATLMPARAPCPEVAEAVKAQLKFVRIARLMSELAAATAPPVMSDVPLPRPRMVVPQKPEVVSGLREQTPARAGIKIKDRTMQTAAKESAKMSKETSNRKRIAAR